VIDAEGSAVDAAADRDAATLVANDRAGSVDG
jgi:hypothetical protein